MTHESRIFKESDALVRLRLFSQVLLIGVLTAGLPSRQVRQPGVEILRFPRSAPRRLPAQLRKVVGLVTWAFRVYREVQGLEPACINCHSLPCLPLAVMLKVRTGARLVYDAHELETETNGLQGLRKLLSKAVERVLYRFVDETIVVSESIADWYAQAYGRGRPAVVLNCPPRRDHIRTDALRRILSIEESAIIFLYQGILGPGRGVKPLLDAFEAQTDDERVLVLMGMGPYEQLVREAAGRRRSIRFHPAVPPDELIAYTASADVGVCLIEDTCLSYRYCMPNKLFEYFSAGIPVIVSDLPEIARVVQDGGAGWVASLDTGALARTIGAIRPTDLSARRHAVRELANRYTWEAQATIIRSVYERLARRVAGALPNRAED
jgi:glycosyltransferase involved in cell wall biosynthesis